MVFGSCRTFLIAPFLRRIYAVTDTVISGGPVRDNGGNRDVSRNASAMLSFAPHHVGNGFIRSARYGFASSFWSC